MLFCDGSRWVPNMVSFGDDTRLMTHPSGILVPLCTAARGAIMEIVPFAVLPESDYEAVLRL